MVMTVARTKQASWRRATLRYGGAFGLLTLCVVGCQSQAPHTQPSPDVTAVAPPPGALPTPDPAAGAAAPAPPTGGAGAGGAGGAGTEGTLDAPEAGAAGAMPLLDEPGDHCLVGYTPAATDAQLTGEPDEFVASNGDVDLVLPAPVLAWMDERVWKQSHDAWHNVRRCNSFFPGFGGSNICKDHPELVAEHQECSDAEDGFEFLLMHRHMLEGLKQAFPQHAQLFEGFPSFPFQATDVPEPWRGRFGTGWSAQIQSTAQTLDDIEHHLDQFPTEGDLGQYIQCGGMGGTGMSSIHGAMHFKWVVNESPNSLGTQAVNIGNFMFWKLHGWIDQVWARYRVAKGLAPDEPAMMEAMVEQCRQMDALGLVFDPTPADPGQMPTNERGVFVDSVRPILESKCAGCHGGAMPMAGLPLAGSLSSATIVEQLVNVASKDGGQFKRVVPGAPEQSWLYLKVTGTAGGAGCVGTCNTQGMPPTGQVELSSAQLEAIRQWILDGAPAPTTMP